MTETKCTKHRAIADKNGSPEFGFDLGGSEYVECSNCYERQYGEDMYAAIIEAATGTAYQDAALFRRRFKADGSVTDEVIEALLAMEEALVEAGKSDVFIAQATVLVGEMKDRRY